MHQRRETGSINDLLRFTPTAIIHILSDITMNTGAFPVGLLGCAPAQPNLLLLANFGERVQYSVFACHVSLDQVKEM